MGFLYWLIKTATRSIFVFIIFAVLVTFIPNLPPFTKFSSIQIKPLKPRVGVLSPNSILNNAQKLYKDELLGPEAFQIHKGELFTSLATGHIVKISPSGQITPVIQIGKPCKGLVEEHICGRPLGFHIDSVRDIMYVADAYHGIWKVDLKTNKKQLLVSPHKELNGKVPKIFMSPVLDENGILYWNHVSTDFDLKDGVFTMFSDPSGRLFKYNMATNESELLVDGLWFPNGMVVSPNNDFLLIAETVRHSLSKYYIEGPKKGKLEVLVDGLPGTPDNMQALPDGSGVLVALYTVFDDDEPSLLRSVSTTPLIRKFVSRLLRLIELPFEFISKHYPHVVFEEIVYSIGHFKSIANLTPAVSGLLHIDWEGNILGAYFNTDRTAGSISDAIVFNDKLYMGSPHSQNYIAAVPVPPNLKKAFTPPSSKEPEAVKVNMKPQEDKAPKVNNKSNPPKAVNPKDSTVKGDKKPIDQSNQQKKQEVHAEKAAKNVVNDKNKDSKTPKPKPTESKTVPEPKLHTKTNTQRDQKPVKKPEQIPIKEELVSDTVKPKEEKLRVIKKSGPTEMPIPSP